MSITEVISIVPILGQVISATVTGWVIWRKLRPFIHQSIRRQRLVDQMLVTFGSEAASQLKQLFHEARIAHDSMEIRQNIVCEKLGIGVYMCDLNARCTYVNPKLAEMFSMSRSDMMGWGWLSSVADTDKERVRLAWAMAVKEQLPYRERYHLRSGHLVMTEAWLAANQTCYVGYIVQTDTTGCLLHPACNVATKTSNKHT